MNTQRKKMQNLPSAAKGIADAVNLLNALSNPDESRKLLQPLIEYVEQAKEYFEAFTQIEKLGEYIADETQKVVDVRVKVESETRDLAMQVSAHQSHVRGVKATLEQEQANLKQHRMDVELDQIEVTEAKAELKERVAEVIARERTVLNNEANVIEREKEVEAKVAQIRKANEMIVRSI